MTEPPHAASSPRYAPGTTSSDWAGARGDKWRDQAAGMEATLAPIDEPLLGALRLDAAYRIADVGCGGGGTALEVARRAPAGSFVHGFDISPALVEHARGRSVELELELAPSALAFDTADVAKSPPPAGPFDRLTSRFGTMFFDDPPAAFANLARWLAPSGRFAFAVWGPSADNPWLTSARDATLDVIDVQPVDPDGPNPFRYAQVEKLFALLEAAGLRDLAALDWRGELPVGGGLGAPDAATFAFAAISSFGEKLAEAGPDAFARAHATLTERFARHERDGVVRLGARVHLVTGAASS